MKPLVAIVGRPNVGKSTLFNRLIGQRKAIVLDIPGVTRDRHYGEGDWAGTAYTVIDTGGFEPLADGILASMRAQAMMAIREADVVICVLDGRDGLLPADREVVQLLRQAQHKTVFAVNKIDGARQEGLVADFYALGLKHAYPVSAEHGRGVGDMLDTVLTLLPPPSDEPEIALDDLETTRIALVGRPNVGKSTLTNRMLGEERMIVDSVAGTTRDAIDSPLSVRGKDYLLIDTAGLRRPRGVKRHTSEGFSVLRTLRAMDRCHVAILMIDAEEGATDQDARIAGDCHERGRGLIIAVNKWDAIEKTDKTARDVVDAIRRKLPFCTYAPVIQISGLTGQRVHKLLGMVDKVREGHRFRVGTGELNRWLERTLFKHQPAVTRGRRLRMYYATQARVAPPTIVISCNEPLGVHFSYKRYLINQFREAFSVEGTPIRLIFRGKKNNPYAEVEE